jgi:hypothetical protein
MRLLILSISRCLERNDRKILFVAMVAIVALGLLYSMHLGSHLQYWDENRYLKLAGHLVKDHAFSMDGKVPEIYRPPGYPIFLSIFVFFGSGIVVLRAFNFVLLALCLYVIHLILRTKASRFAAALGTLIAATCPVFFYCAGTLMPQILSALLLLILIHICTSNHISNRGMIVSGLIYGFLVLAVPTFIFLLPVLAVWLLVARKSPESRRLLVAAAIGCLVIGAWTLRNHHTSGSFVFVSSNSGINLLLGNSENTRPDSGMNVDISRYITAADKAGMNEVQRSSFYRSQALEWIKNNKAAAAKLYCLKVLNNFSYKNQLNTKAERSSAGDIVMLLWYGPLFLLFLVRLLLWRRFPPARFEQALIGLYVIYAFAAAVFFTRIRFRIPFDYLMIAVIAIFVQDWMRTMEKPANPRIPDSAN